MKQLVAHIRRQEPVRLHMIGGATLVAILALFSGLALPAWSHWNKQSELKLSREFASERLNATRSRVESVRAALAALTSWDDASKDLLSATFERRILTVSDLASANQMLVDSVEPKQSVGNAAPSVAVNAHGQYEQILRWIDELRKTAPDLQIQSLQLSSAANGLCAIRVIFHWSSPPALPLTVLSNVQEGT